MDEKTMIASAMAVCGTALTCLVGGWNSMLGILAILICMDYATGLMKGAKSGKLSSAIGYAGLMKKAGIFMVIIVAHQLDMASGVEPAMFKAMAVYFYIGNEGVSVLENMAEIGVPLPDFLGKAFKGIEEANNDKKGA